MFRNYLRQSNNKLISYIEKARIMAQAYGIGRSIPNSINVYVSVCSTHGFYNRWLLISLCAHME